MTSFAPTSDSVTNNAAGDVGTVHGIFQSETSINDALGSLRLDEIVALGTSKETHFQKSGGGS